MSNSWLAGITKNIVFHDPYSRVRNYKLHENFPVSRDSGLGVTIRPDTYVCSISRCTCRSPALVDFLHKLRAPSPQRLLLALVPPLCLSASSRFRSADNLHELMEESTSNHHPDQFPRRCTMGYGAWLA